MRVGRVKAENFGPHANLDWKTEAGLVGIIGPNGSGKSHILLALRFALTGELPGNRKTYIKTGAKSGFVEVWFVQNGVEGRVKRFLHNSKRELDWDDKSYTKAAEVDEMFNEILGTRKESFKNTSFIDQGDMKNVLDGTETQRRNVLIKLLSLGYVERRRGQLDQKIEQYAKHHLDESVYGRRDQLREQVDAVTKEVTDLTTSLQSMAMYEPDITAVQTFLSQRKALEDEKQNLSTVEQQIRVNFNPETIREHERVVEAIAEHESKLTIATQRARECAEHKQAATRSQVLKDSLDKLDQDVASSNSCLEMYRAQFKALTDSDDVVNAADILKRREQELQDMRAALALQAQLEVKQPELDEVRDELKDYTEEGLKGLQKQYADASNQALLSYSRTQAASTSLKALEATAGDEPAECTGDKLTCAKCSLKVIPKSMITPEYIAAAKERLEQDQAEMNKLHAERDELAEKVEAYRNKRDSLTKAVVDLDKEITQINDDLRRMGQPPSQNDVDRLAAKLDNTKTVTSLIAQEQTKLKIAQQNASRTRGEIEALKLPENVDVEHVDENLAEANQTVRDIETNLTNLREQRNKTAETYRQREQALERKRYLKEDRVPALQLAVDNFEPSENVDKLLKKLNTNNFEVVYDTMVEMHEKYLEVKTTLHTKRTSLADLQRQLIQTEVSIGRQEQHKRVLDKLRELRSLLEADGVLKSYLSYRFRRLHNTVSKNLNLLDANFVIRPCPDSLSYEFRRSDSDGSDSWLDITKLSGGQKVKLSTAFLISVQETICQDVNFLVLDEPSTHLDEASVEALSSLFTDLATRMDNGNGQIWIVDHHFSLQGACSSSFQLGSEQTENE